MRKNLFVRSIAAVSGIVMLASLAACGDNTSSAGNNSGSTSTEKITGSFSGAGATSQQAAEEAWISAYMAANSGANVTYNPTGSGAGVTTFLSGATAWAGSDKALSDDEVTQSSDKACANGTTAFDVPVYISPIAIIFNLKGVSDAGKHINLDADTAAKIFDGKIVKWNDPAIANQNKDLTLPDTQITVVHRSDKSGTTQNFVSYFKDQAPDSWTHELSENWPDIPGQQSAKGTSGVVTAVKLKSTKNGSMMAYVTVEDDTAAIELVVFPKALQQCGAYLTADSAVLLTGRIDAREEEAPKVLLNEAQPLNEGAVNALTTAEKPAASVFSDAEAAKRAPHKLYIRLDSLKGVKWPGIRAVLSTCPGDTPVYLYPLDTKKTTLVSRRLWCRPDENILQKLRFLLSEDDVIIK